MPENNRYAYYPGCSAGSAAKAYDISTRAIGKILGLEYREIDDWNCCGATEYFSLNSIAAYSLVARNLSLATETGAEDLVIPCSACYLNFKKTDKNMDQHEALNQQVNQALSAGGLLYKPGSMHVRHLLNMLVEDFGISALKEEVTNPLKGLRVAPYYGCLIVRPGNGYNPEYPTHLDDLMRAMGAEVVDFPLKTHCCGGHMTQISEKTAYELLRRLLHSAAEYQADVIVTLCPMCQLNLDVYQPQVNRKLGTDFEIPVLYFTQLLGLAFGLQPQELGFGSEIVSAEKAISKIGRVSDRPAHMPRQKRDKNALPVPEKLP